MPVQEDAAPHTDVELLWRVSLILDSVWSHRGSSRPRTMVQSYLSHPHLYVTGSYRLLTWPREGDQLRPAALTWFTLTLKGKRRHTCCCTATNATCHRFGLKAIEPFKEMPSMVTWSLLCFMKARNSFNLLTLHLWEEVTSPLTPQI